MMKRINSGFCLGLAIGMLCCVQAETIRYGSLNQSDEGVYPDISISFSGGYLFNGEINTDGALGTFYQKSAPAHLTDSISGSGLVLTAKSLKGSGGMLKTNRAGSRLAVKGGVGENLIDANEEITLSFNQDVRLRHIRLSSTTAPGTIGVILVNGVETRFNSDDGEYVLLENVQLSAGQNLVLTTDPQGGEGWGIHSIVVETVSEVLLTVG